MKLRLSLRKAVAEQLSAMVGIVESGGTVRGARWVRLGFEIACRVLVAESSPTHPSDEDEHKLHIHTHTHEKREQ